MLPIFVSTTSKRFMSHLYVFNLINLMSHFVSKIKKTLISHLTTWNNLMSHINVFHSKKSHFSSLCLQLKKSHVSFLCWQLNKNSSLISVPTMWKISCIISVFTTQKTSHFFFVCTKENLVSHTCVYIWVKYHLSSAKYSSIEMHKRQYWKNKHRFEDHSLGAESSF